MWWWWKRDSGKNKSGQDAMPYHSNDDHKGLRQQLLGRSLASFFIGRVRGSDKE